MERDVKSKINFEIEKIAELLREELKDSSPIFDKFVEPLVKAGGKRLRARLCLLIALSGSSDEEQRRLIASAIELLHLATLVHDDVLDEAEIRRGITTIHKLEGNKTAILSGDYLFAKAFQLIGKAGNLQYLQIFTQVIIDLVEGEFLQMEDIGCVDQDIDRYLLKTRKKTADLIEVAVELGARMGGYKEEDVSYFKAFGQSLGMLFQITDDVMDYTSTEAISGKPAGKDLEEGVLTYPLLSIKREDNRDYLAEEVKAIMAGSAPGKLMKYVVKEGGLHNTILLARSYEKIGKEALEQLPDFEGKDILMDSLISLLNRTK